MDNQEKKVEVITKTSIATQIATGIGILSIVAAGGGLIAYLALAPAPRISTEIVRDARVPQAFSLLSPVGGATDQDDAVTLSWNASSTDAPAITYKTASLEGVSYKLAGVTIQYKVYLGTTTTNMTQKATVSDTSYTATDLLAGTTYYWKIQAYNSYGSKYSSTWNFSTAGADWIQNLDGFEICTKPPCYSDQAAAACGGNRACDADGILSCAEWNDVWLTCSGVTNKCPDNLEEKCLQMTICQCSGATPGNQQCNDFIATFTDPCGGY